MLDQNILSNAALSDAALDQLFLEARTHYAWTDKAVPDETLHALYDLVKMGPTSMNNSPARFVFLTSDAAKARLKPHLMDGNVEKTMTAPVTVIAAWDKTFYENMPQLFPHSDGARDMMKKTAETNGYRNGTLQGAYLILAARALGLDVGPMSGFSIEGVDKEFFSGDTARKDWTANFLVNLGYGSGEKLFERLPRLSFDEAATIL
ncbi:MAG: malonic semialdehyde reductase [Rhodobacterales bacterium CG15_BIG_FIL_POST_REV_8_21_14_020_59_13]|nr:MAG: malonic semialdehyde reductase [Rhodobacterales bacterium CG15_BIG_FIL_POST_REV_8_21_14_020_59_13]